MRKSTIYILLFLALTSFSSFLFVKKYSLKYYKNFLNRGYAFVPSGNTLVNEKLVSVQSFYMLKTEISNFTYKEYLTSLKMDGKFEEYKAAIPDSTVWNQLGVSNQKMIDWYFTHPAYRDYPVVGVSKAQAEKFCEWITVIWRKNLNDSTIVFRLPHEAEFKRAACGDSINQTYAWKGKSMFNAKKQMLCNHLNSENMQITRDENGELKIIGFSSIESENTDFIAPIESYWPNVFGIYNLNGNISEMLSSSEEAIGGSFHSPAYDVRNDAKIPFTKPSCFVGFRIVMTHRKI